MPVTYQDVYAALSPEEPDYERATGLGAEALPHLEAMVRGDDVMLASKATYLAGLLGGEGSAAILRQAAGHQEAALRVAAAAALSNIPSAAAEPSLEALLGDADVGVRKVALRSVKPDASPQIRRRVQEMAQSGPLQEISSEVMGRLKP